jgi:predicted MPP superfamily phosphohydrolase
MRSFSLLSILLLCLAIVLVDITTFYWLQSITTFISSPILKKTIQVLFWVFTVGLITAIIVLKTTLDDINPKRKHLLISSLYGLTVSSFIPKIIFVIIVSLLFFTRTLIPEKVSVILVPVIGLFSGFLPFFVIVYAIFKAAYHFKVYHHNISFDQLPKSFHGLKIVHISDLHIGGFNYQYKILGRAVKLINKLKPDIIFFTGDLVNNYAWELRGWETVLDKLVANMGKFAVLGNHDYGDYSEWDTTEEKKENLNTIKQFYKKIDFTLLLNQSRIIENNHEQIALIGVENWGKPPFKQYGDLETSLKNVSTIPFKILLSHDPTHWSEQVIDKTDIALTLSGHTHGLQLGFNYKKLKWSPIKYKYKHWAGLYKHNKQYLHVNRGLGWLGFPGRIGMRPEISSIELSSSGF